MPEVASLLFSSNVDSLLHTWVATSPSGQTKHHQKAGENGQRHESRGQHRGG